MHPQWMISPSKFALLFCIVHFSLEYQLGHLFGTAVRYASRLVVPHLKLKNWGHEGNPSVSGPFGGAWAMWLIFVMLLLNPPYIWIQYLLGTFWSLDQRSSRSLPLSHVSPGLRNPALWSWRLIRDISQLTQRHCGHCMHRSDAAKVENSEQKGGGFSKRLKHHRRRCMGWGRGQGQGIGGIL